MKIAILNISIGSYDVFWKDFLLSAEKNFLPGLDKHYFLFTDNNKIYNYNSKKVSLIYQDNLGWPLNTMKRFNMFKKCEDELKKFDYIFFINGNAEFKKPLTEDFINKEKNLITIIHPGLADLKISQLPFERRPESNAYIPIEKGKYYVQGAFIGGKSDGFIKMMNELDKLIEEDLNNHIIAIWHDESFLNKYICDRDDVQIMGRQYLYYEEYVFPWEPIILLRDKTKYIEKNNGRFVGRVSIRSKIALIIRNIFWKIQIKLRIKKRLFNLENGKYYDIDVQK